MGRKLFDYAFKEYARRWAFKHPTPADLFRTMEDASAEDLDWFWRGWFYGIEPCDISLDSVQGFTPDLISNPQKNATVKQQQAAKPLLNTFEDISKIRNREDKNIAFAVDADTSLRDFYYNYARGEVNVDTSFFDVKTVQYEDTLSQAEKTDLAKNKFVYQLNFTNKGGLVMPIIIEWTYGDGTKEVERIAAQIWRKNENAVSKVFVKSKEVKSIVIDPMKETADINETNNVWPTVDVPSKFQLYKAKLNSRGQSSGGNPMQKQMK
jgi:hypothetical protein